MRQSQGRSLNLKTPYFWSCSITVRSGVSNNWPMGHTWLMGGSVMVPGLLPDCHCSLHRSGCNSNQKLWTLPLSPGIHFLCLSQGMGLYSGVAGEPRGTWCSSKAPTQCSSGEERMHVGQGGCGPDGGRGSSWGSLWVCAPCWCHSWGIQVLDTWKTDSPVLGHSFSPAKVLWPLLPITILAAATYYLALWMLHFDAWCSEKKRFSWSHVSQEELQ